MKKNSQKTVFVCQECGYESPKWAGQCICGAWNTFVEERVATTPENDARRRTASASGSATAAPLSSVKSGEEARISTGISELDRVLGGGIVKGSLTLIAGEPGIGKSTIIIEAAAKIASAHGPVLYVSGEESEEQIKMRADRVCKDLPDTLLILAETNVEQIAAVTDKVKPVFLIIDSIQTMYSASLESAPGSVSQVRACANEFMKIGKTIGIPVFIVAHVTKSGDLAGPKIIEHLVDAVLHFHGERTQDLRILRANKNRFGTTSEIGAFEMREAGLFPVENLSMGFLEDESHTAEGAVATAIYEGTRPLLLEIQALTAPANAGFARRSAIGIDSARLNMIIAVLERRAGISLMNQDIYINIVGGLRPEGTSTDLAAALAIYSSYRSISVGTGTLALGEISLTGHLRWVRNADKIVSEAARMGITHIILPQKNAEKLPTGLPKTIKIDGVQTLSDAISLIR